MSSRDASAWVAGSRSRSGLAGDGQLQSRIASLTASACSAGRRDPGSAQGRVSDMTWQAIGPEKWREWSAATRRALDEDTRKDWGVGEPLGTFSPRGGYLPRSEKAPTLRRDCWPSDVRPQRQPGRPGALRSGAARLGLVQLKEVIEFVYASKEERDVLYTASGLQQQTMQEHAEEWLDRAAVNLKQQQGSDAVNSDALRRQVFQAVKQYKGQDWQVALFGKILRNRVDEQFRFVVLHLRDAIHHLLCACLAATHGEEAARRIVVSRKQGRLHEDEWGDIVRYLYKASDAAALVGRVYDFIAVSAPQRVRRGPISVRTADDRSIAYRDFEQIVLSYQMDAYESHISRFVRLFRRHDANADGVLSEAEFGALYNELAPRAQPGQVAAIMDSVDPNGSGRVTFSEAVAFLSDEISAWLDQQLRDEQLAAATSAR
eukprot:TRINITY_DN7501_c0_g1_i2.p1 TRINITY_DN7501_c0_g1~~TRINITY_DN7501_c0_g1_i2.p1  ORF type:complete len:457 (+),score=154.95 TRINITY_DN7501_c0_g1_i2:78-1373(+)